MTDATRLMLHSITKVKDADHVFLVGWDANGEAWEFCVENGWAQRWSNWRRCDEMDFIREEEVQK